MKKQRNLTRFENWTIDDLHVRLRVIPQQDGDADRELRQWLATPLRSDAPADLEVLRTYLAENYLYWNEIELISHFIIPVLDRVRFGNRYYRLFQEKNLRAKVQDYDVQGKVDGMVAFGVGEFPSQPYFFLHEYKRLKGTDADPLGQLLITMLAAQAENDIQRPIYGCFVIGVLWRFVVLAGNRYACSPTYEAVETEELHQIYALLHYVKQKVVEDIRKTYPDAD